MLLSALSLYLFAAVLLSASLSAYVFSKGRSVLAMMFSALCLCVAVYLFGYLMEINCDDIDRMKFWNQVQYFSIPFYPVFWVLLAFVNARIVSRLRRSILIPAFILPALTFLFRLTNDFHHLFYRSMTVRSMRFFPVLALGKGPWYFIQDGYLLICFCFATYFFYTRCRGLVLERKRSYQLLLGGAVLPFVGLALIVADFGNLGLDYTAFFIPVSLVFIQSALFRFDILEIKSLARESIFENGTDAMILLDDSRSLTDFNLSARFLFPELTSMAKGMPLDRVFGKRGEFLDALSAAASSSDALYRANDGRFFQIAEVRILNRFGNAAGSLLRLTDCTETRRAHARLLERATTDELTGLFNRGAFLARARDEFENSRSMKTDFSLIMIDIDHFKAINDNYGHAGGDEVLRFLGRELRSRFRATDVPARIGGEEFAVLLPGASSEAAFNAAEKFRALIGVESVDFESRSITFTLSLGVARFSAAYPDFESMMKAADKALYESKAGGRNRTTAVGPD